MIFKLLNGGEGDPATQDFAVRSVAGGLRGGTRKNLRELDEIAAKFNGDESNQAWQASPGCSCHGAAASGCRHRDAGYAYTAVGVRMQQNVDIISNTKDTSKTAGSWASAGS